MSFLGLHTIGYWQYDTKSDAGLSFTQQGSDPSTYEMIQKIHTLQRRLIQKTEEVATSTVSVAHFNSITQAH